MKSIVAYIAGFLTTTLVLSVVLLVTMSKEYALTNYFISGSAEGPPSAFFHFLFFLFILGFPPSVAFFCSGVVIALILKNREIKHATLYSIGANCLGLAIVITAFFTYPASIKNISVTLIAAIASAFFVNILTGYLGGWTVKFWRSKSKERREKIAVKNTYS